MGARLVQDAGSTLGDFVAIVQRASDVIGEITAAGAEQSQGIAQVNGAVSKVDQMTQQNASLVEESAAAAESLKDQAQRLTESMQEFQLSGNAMGAPVTAAAVARPGPSALAAHVPHGRTSRAQATGCGISNRPQDIARAAITQAR